MSAPDREYLTRIGAAAWIGVAVNTVDQWRYRKIFPEPYGYMANSPYWMKADIERWLKQTGRERKAPV